MTNGLENRKRETSGDYFVQVFTPKQSVLLKKEADRLYPQWIAWQGKGSEAFNNLLQPGQLLLRKRLHPTTIAGDAQVIWGFRDADFGAVYALLLDHVTGVGWELGYYDDEDIKYLGWPRPIEILLPDTRNGETQG